LTSKAHFLAAARDGEPVPEMVIEIDPVSLIANWVQR